MIETYEYNELVRVYRTEKEKYERMLDQAIDGTIVADGIISSSDLERKIERQNEMLNSLRSQLGLI